MPSSPTLSHKFSRAFRPDLLHPPRDFAPLAPNEPRKQNGLVLEIGTGKGRHALLLAQAHKERTVVALERTKEKFSAFARKLDELDQAGARPGNLTAVHADALPWCVHALAPRSLHAVYLLYPNPEVKNAAQRWLNMPFFEFLLSRMQEGAQLTLATNIEHYAKEALDQATGVWQLPARLSDVPVDSKRTHFEEKYLARTERCTELTLHKPAGYVTRFDTWSAC